MSGLLYNPTYGEGYNPIGGYTQLTVTPEDDPAAEVQEQVNQELGSTYQLGDYTITGGYASPTTTSGSGSTAVPGVASGPGLGTGSTAATWWSTILADIENFAERFGVILFAIVLAIIALREMVK